MFEILAHLMVLAGLIISAFLVFYFSDLMAAALASGLFSFLVSLEFFILQAPDVAISQAGIGAGLTTAIFIVAIRGTQRFEGEGK